MFGKKTLFSAFLGILALTTAAQAIPRESLNVNGSNRSMLVYAPANIEANRPLIIQMHGMSQSAQYQYERSGWEAIADTARFVIVFPDGENKSWDISGDKDVNFLKAIINDMNTKYGIDKKRVYVSGFSMGGMMSYHAANKMGDMIAAIAPCSGYPIGNPAPASKRMMPILHTHGTADDVVNYNSGVNYLKRWVDYEACSGSSEKISKYPDYRPNTAASLEKWTGCKDNSEIRLVTIEGKGHWYSMDLASVNTSEEIWNFAKRFSLDGAAEDVPATPAFVEPTKRDSIYNGDFEEEAHAWTLQNHGDASSTGTVKDGAYNLSISAVGAQPYTVQLIQHNIVLEKDQWYEVSFDASASAARTLEVNVEQHVDPWASYLTDKQNFEIGTEKKTYTFKFQMTAATDEDSRLSFNAGAAAVNLTLDNVKLKKIEAPATTDSTTEPATDPTTVSATDPATTPATGTVEGSTADPSAVPATDPAGEKQLIAGNLKFAKNAPQAYKIFSLKGNLLGKVTATNLDEVKSLARNIVPTSGVYFVGASKGANAGLRRMILTK